MQEKNTHFKFQKMIFLALMGVIVAGFLMGFVSADYTNQSDGFKTDTSGAGAIYAGIALDTSDNSFWAVDYLDFFAYHFNSAGVNQSDGISIGVELANAFGVAYDSSDDTIWVSDNQDDVLYHFDMASVNQTDAINTQTSSGAGDVYDVAYDTSDDSLWFVDLTDNFLYHVNSAGANQSDGIDIGSAGCADPWGVAYDASDGSFWVADKVDDFIYHFNSAGVNQTDGFKTTDFGSDAPSGIAVSAAGNNFWIFDSTDLFIYHVISDEVISTLTNSLNSPANNSYLSSSTNYFSANYTYENMNISNATYYIWYSNNTLFNETKIAVSSALNTTNLSVSGFVYGIYKWNVYACGENSTDVICSWGSTGNYTLNIAAQVDAESYPAQVYETEYTTFRINITIVEGASLFAARLVYNGTSYLATKTSLGSSQYELVRKIDIPLLNGDSQNLTFFWNFEYKDGLVASENSSERSHNVSRLIFTQVNATHITPFINFTAYNETSQTGINFKIKSTFYYWLGKGDVIKNYSMEVATDTSSYAFSLNTNRSVNVSSTINIQTSLNFSERTFYFNKERYNDTITRTKLYLHDGAGSRNIIIQVRDSGLVPIQGYFVKVYRFYPENNSYEIIERARTDEYGQFVARLVEPNTIKYQFEFLDLNNVVKKRTDDMTIACRTTICVIPFVIEDITSDFDVFQNGTDYDWSFTFDNSTNMFTFTWEDVSSATAVNWLKVERYMWNGSEIVCNTTSTAKSGSLTCSVGNVEASYQAQVFRSISGGNWRRVAFLSKSVGTTYETYGTEGLIWSFLLLMTMVAIGYWFPPVGIVLYLFGIIGLSLMKIIYLNPAIIIAELVIGIAFIWAFGGRK